MSEETPPGSADRDSEHWFAGKDVDVLIFRINRRPLGDPMLFQPQDFLEHLESVLSGDRAVRSGRRFQREWRVGNRQRVSGALTGMIGWAREGETLSARYDVNTETWQDRVEPSNLSAVSPFAVAAGRRYLGVLKHASFTDRNIPQVFTELLNRGERDLGVPTTAWAVEPVGDLAEFDDWLGTVDQLSQVKFVFRRPNPDAEDEFQGLFDRLDNMRAGQIEERITPADKDEGLDKEGVRDDPTNKAFLAAAMVAFGYVVGRGYRQGKRSTYDQRSHAMREHVENVDPTWDGATRSVLGAVRRALGRYQDDG